VVKLGPSGAAHPERPARRRPPAAGSARRNQPRRV